MNIDLTSIQFFGNINIDESKKEVPAWRNFVFTAM